MFSVEFYFVFLISSAVNQWLLLKVVNKQFLSYFNESGMLLFFVMTSYLGYHAVSVTILPLSATTFRVGETKFHAYTVYSFYPKTLKKGKKEYPSKCSDRIVDFVRKNSNCLSTT